VHIPGSSVESHAPKREKAVWGSRLKLDPGVA
jgi:hypothetical protein